VRSTDRWFIALIVALGVVSFSTAGPAQSDGCVGDCDGDSVVTESDLVIAVGDALDDSESELCDAPDVDPPDGRITVNEIVLGVNEVGLCPSSSQTPTATQTGAPTLTASPDASEPPTQTRTQTATTTRTPSVSPTPTSATRTPTPTATATTAFTPIAQAIERDGNGVALHGGETLTTEGVATVAAGVLQNNKLKIFLQDGAAGIEVFNANAGAFPVIFQAGDRLRVSGVITQDPDPTSSNRALGTVTVSIGNTSWTRISQGNPLPEPILTDLTALLAPGNPYTGSVVRVNDVHKVAGQWPVAGQQTTQVTIGDTTGATIVLRFQRNTISTPELPNKLAAIGNAAFDLVSIATQDDPDGSPPYLSGYELWIRGADDVNP
jgi:hypothetical protein